MVRSVFVGHNNKGGQRVYMDSHYLDIIVNNAVIINVHLCSHSEHSACQDATSRAGQFRSRWYLETFSGFSRSGRRANTCLGV
jgi:hypothetical protein